jgi:hypothetical protein
VLRPARVAVLEPELAAPLDAQADQGPATDDGVAE